VNSERWVEVGGCGWIFEGYAFPSFSRWGCETDEAMSFVVDSDGAQESGEADSCGPGRQAHWWYRPD